MGAGVLPISVHKGELYVLLSREHDGRHAGLYSDFGGTPESGETELQTAIRECHEESSGFFGSEEDIERMIREKCVLIMNENKYTCFVVAIDYDGTLPVRFREHFKAQMEKDPDSISNDGLFEKDDLKWVKLDNIYKFLKHVRPFYRKFLKQI